MKRKILFVILIFLLSFLFLGLQIDENEIKSVKTDIQFVNYTGKHTYIETVFDIRLIGTKLANGVKDNDIPFNYLMKYSIIHAIDQSDDTKFNAAIFSIDKDAKVDHIRNVREIISAYLEKKFGYTRKDGFTLATFLTFYNATYRGNVEYFTEKYKPIVIKHITKENVGISVKYFEWPGATKILIPLTEDAKKGNLSSLDTTELTDKKVIEDLKTRDDKGIKERKDMVDLKEKEIENKTIEIEKEKKQIEKEKDQVKIEEKKIEDKKDSIKERKDELAQKEEKLKQEKENIQDPNKLKEIDNKEKQLQKDKEKLQTEEDKVKQDEKKLEDKKQEIKDKEEKVAEKEKTLQDKKQEVADDKKDIRQDEIKQKIEDKPDQAKLDLEKQQKDLEKKEEKLVEKEKQLDERENTLKDSQLDKSIFANKLFYLKIKEYMEGGHYNNEMYLINPKNRKIELKSELTNICGHKYDVAKDGVVVIAHQGQHTTAHNLVLLDRETLKIKSRSNDDIFWRSFVEIKEDFIYAVIKQTETDYYLGKFNLNMELVNKSAEKVESNTFITFFEDSIFINSVDKKILVLKKDDLNLVEKIEP
ncbi:MAG: hypothetical protein A2086_05445 [Spirochaetes bacterium GWD1_27_9]|nr:MAG: hypothetical protein A2Z98_15900 [Spirochaetes bacterium GWB1_27_13]OHD26138.1 MAG: hypothetical protein A2Y34_07190 [Spirochaetes bacterium GWC1_27_15]OHD31822.1 MAG: hypothetical protein A2086_05445 [Spirochaetes bacterium GWD1_27_9]